MAAIKYRSRRNQRRLRHRCKESLDRQERLALLVRREHLERRERREKLEHPEHLRRQQKNNKSRISGYILDKRIYPEFMNLPKISSIGILHQ